MSYNRLLQAVFALVLCVNFYYCQENGIFSMKIDPESLSRPGYTVKNIADLQNGPVDETVYKITINLTTSLHVTQERFLSICIDTNRVSQGLPGLDLSSPKLQNMAAALSPTNIRIGGTKADFLIFDPTADDIVPNENITDFEPDFTEFDAEFFGYEVGKNIKNFTLPGKTWEKLTSFFLAVGWDLMFDFNLFLFKDGLWDSANAELLLDYSTARGIPIPSFQLGNEPNSFMYNFNISIPPGTLVKDFRILNSLLDKYPLYKNSGVYGPDVTTLDRRYSARSYLEGFIAAGGADVVDEISLHQYYLNGRTATAEGFLDPDVMDTLKLTFEYARNITAKASKPIPVRLTETSSCYGGGALGLSDAYVAGFLWLDKLGLAAQNGITHVFRQTFYGGRYALITNTMDPLPDYYLTVLYKRLIEGPVFNISMEPTIPSLRVYGHCAKRDRYPAGALVLYFLNLQASPVTLSTSQFTGNYLDLYLLTPGDSQGLKSKFVKLNGEKLEIQGSLLPQLLPKPHKGDVTVDGQSFGFIAVPNAKASLCEKYHEEKDIQRKKDNIPSSENRIVL